MQIRKHESLVRQPLEHESIESVRPFSSNASHPPGAKKKNWRLHPTWSSMFGWTPLSRESRRKWGSPWHFIQSWLQVRVSTKSGKFDGEKLKWQNRRGASRVYTLPCPYQISTKLSAISLPFCDLSQHFPTSLLGGGGLEVYCREYFSFKVFRCGRWKLESSDMKTLLLLWKGLSLPFLKEMLPQIERPHGGACCCGCRLGKDMVNTWRRHRLHVCPNIKTPCKHWAVESKQRHLQHVLSSAANNTRLHRRL